MAAVTDENGSQVVGYSYDADGNLSERTVLRNNLTATYTYDYQNHLTAMKNQTSSEIVPMLADRGSYIASESTFYKVLKEAKQLTHRGREQRKHKRPISTHKATRANQVWMWDITYLNGPIKGMHYYLYMFSDLYSRKIVGWEVWESEDAKHASELVKRIYRDEKIYQKYAERTIGAAF